MKVLTMSYKVGQATLIFFCMFWAPQGESSVGVVLLGKNWSTPQ